LSFFDGVLCNSPLPGHLIPFLTTQFVVGDPTLPIWNVTAKWISGKSLNTINHFISGKKFFSLLYLGTFFLRQIGMGWISSILHQHGWGILSFVFGWLSGWKDKGWLGWASFVLAERVDFLMISLAWGGEISFYFCMRLKQYSVHPEI
jgi:hypothetical protein